MEVDSYVAPGWTGMIKPPNLPKVVKDISLATARLNLVYLLLILATKCQMEAYAERQIL